MPAAITTNKNAYGYLDPITLTITGALANTPYTVTVVNGTGHTSKLEVMTDGTGAATISAVYQASKVAPLNVTLRTTAEHKGSSTPAASITTTGA